MRYFLIGMLLLQLLRAQPMFEVGRQHFDDGNFTGAFGMFLRAADEENDEEAALYLGWMYEYGIGVDPDQDAALYWYKASSQTFHEEARKRTDWEIAKERRRLMANFDVNDTTAREVIERKIQSLFGLKAHNANYFLPVGYGDFVYHSYVPSDKYMRWEAEFQISLKFDLFSDLLGLGEIYSIGYTQQSLWQIYAVSKPFRETNYNPEVFVVVPVDRTFGDLFLKGVSFAFAHQSNGQGNVTEQGLPDANVTQSAVIQANPYWAQNRSRSWNYLTASLLFNYQELLAELRGWVRIPDEAETDDNPDLIQYLGHGSLKLYYAHGKSMFEMLGRYNLIHRRGAIQANWSYPIGERTSTFWYVKLFSGYGESLIDYNNYVNKIAVGFCFSR